jgi:hypothetical protein
LPLLVCKTPLLHHHHGRHGPCGKIPSNCPRVPRSNAKLCTAETTKIQQERKRNRQRLLCGNRPLHTDENNTHPRVGSPRSNLRQTNMTTSSWRVSLLFPTETTAGLLLTVKAGREEQPPPPSKQVKARSALPHQRRAPGGRCGNKPHNNSSSSSSIE